MSPVFTTTAHVASPATALSAADIANIFEHSWPVETAGATLITVLVTWLVTVAVSIDHRSGHPGDLGRTPNKYQFWTAEYLYTYGQPSPLASAFIAHLTYPAAVSDLTSAGYLPCPPGSSGTAAALCKLAGT